MHLQMNYVKLLFAHVTVLHASFLVCIVHQQIGQFVKYRSMWLWIMTDARTKSRGFDDEIIRKLDSVDQLSGVLCSTWQWSFQIDLGFKGLLFGLIRVDLVDMYPGATAFVRQRSRAASVTASMVAAGGVKPHAQFQSFEFNVLNTHLIISATIEPTAAWMSHSRGTSRKSIYHICSHIHSYQ